MILQRGGSMGIYIFLPIVIIVAVVAYTLWVRARTANLTPEQAAEQFHASYAPYFKLKGGERIVGVWNGVEFQGKKSAAGHMARDAINAASAELVGVSTYIPTVQVGLTSGGRLLVSREYSDLGERGIYKQHVAFNSGVEVLDAGAAYPGQHLGAPPKNPANPMVPLEFVQLRSRHKETYDAWLSPQGARIGHAGYCSILSGLD